MIGIFMSSLVVEQLVSAWKCTYIYGDPGNVKDLRARLILGNISVRDIRNGKVLLQIVIFRDYL